MILDKRTYEDKVRACWIGKNIGGTMGGPYEHKQQVLDVKGFSTPPGQPLPNDDLDIQLVWLYALERLGPNAINASTLGEYWLNCITPFWNEYGIGKANMQRGLRPGLSGDFQNNWQHSNGAWIRTEIWACSAPALPSAAARYAVEDAKVDHGAGEGTYAAAFVATMQSAAFAIDNLRLCIELGLASIPESCRTARSIKLVLDCYDGGKSWLEARNAVMQSNADLGTGWFEAPSNVGYTILGLIYGEGNFKQSMLTAINCGDDTDCTAATVGATLGILYGMAGIPEDWCTYIGDEIVTISLARGGVLQHGVPYSCNALTQRVVSLAPHVLYACQFQTGRKYAVELGSQTELPDNLIDLMQADIARTIRADMERLQPRTIRFTEEFLCAELTLNRDPVLAPSEELTVHVEVINNRCFESRQYPLNLRWILPDGFHVSCPSSILLDNVNLHGNGRCHADAVICAGDRIISGARLILEITVPGRHTALYASFPIFSL